MELLNHKLYISDIWQLVLCYNTACQGPYIWMFTQLSNTKDAYYYPHNHKNQDGDHGLQRAMMDLMGTEGLISKLRCIDWYCDRHRELACIFSHSESISLVVL